MITTLYSDNKRITGSKMNSAIKKDVLDNGYSKFYDDVRIEEERFLHIICRSITEARI